MALISTGTLAVQIRQEVGFEGDQFVTDLELQDKITRAYRGLYDLLVAARGAEYYRSAATFNTVAGQANYDLPSDFYRLLAVNRTTQTGFWSNIHPYGLDEIDLLLNAGMNGATSELGKYRLGGGISTVTLLPGKFIDFLPVPTAVRTVRVDYLPEAVLKYDPVSTFFWIEDHDGWLEWIIIEVAIQLVAKEEGDPSAFLTRKAAIEARIKALAPSRNASEPERPKDVRRLFEGQGRKLFRPYSKP